MNIILVRKCTNSCPYCFELSESRSGENNLMSLENAHALATWTASAGVESIALLGGEPFLHPYLPEIVNLFQQSCPRLPLTIFSGGIFESEKLNNLSPNNVSFLFNINQPRDYKSLNAFKVVLKNIETAIKAGHSVTLGFNVWSLDFDPNFMPDLAYRLGRDSFRWTVANPQWDAQSTVVPPSHYKELSHKCKNMLERATKLNLWAHLDCPLPPCFFDDADLAWMIKYQPYTATRIGNCDPVVDVTPELEVLRCFALSKLARTSILDFADIRSVVNLLRKEVDAIMPAKGMFPQCLNCEHLTSGRCQGGCLAWKWSEDTHNKNGNTDFTTRIYDLLSSGNPRMALDEVLKSNPLTQTPLNLFLAAVAAQNVGDFSESFRLAARTYNSTTDSSLKSKAKALLNGLPFPLKSIIPDGDIY